MKLDIIYTYFNQREYTREMLLYVDKYIERDFLKDIAFTIVDDNSDYPLMDYLPELNNLNLKIYRTDFDGYNIAGAINLGCIKAETNSVVCLDMDMIIYNNFVKRLLSITPTDEYHHRLYLERAHKVDFALGKIYYKLCGWHGLTTKTNRVKYLHDERFSGNWGYHGVFMRDYMRHDGIKELPIYDQRVIMSPRVYLNKELVFPASGLEYRKHRTAGETPNLTRKKDANKPLYDKLVKQLNDGTYKPYKALNFNYELIYKNF
ncbi:hypothetical protein CMI37_38795 [Candidatus Pacearchaeota archaeon]|nr:hypothetical protein [Candidatus Pacearchaeota archaeon]